MAVISNNISSSNNSSNNAVLEECLWPPACAFSCQEPLQPLPPIPQPHPLPQVVFSLLWASWERRQKKSQSKKTVGNPDDLPWKACVQGVAVATPVHRRKAAIAATFRLVLEQCEVLAPKKLTLLASQGFSVHSYYSLFLVFCLFFLVTVVSRHATGGAPARHLAIGDMEPVWKSSIRTCGLFSMDVYLQCILIIEDILSCEKCT